MSSVEMGAQIRRLREEMGLSLAAASKLILISKSSFHRTEIGERDVTPEDVALLETKLGLGGRLAVEYHREVLEYAAKHLQPAPLWVHAFPGNWAGTVWVQLRPRAKARDVRASILWGSWSRTVEADVIGHPLTVVFGKGSDGESIPLSISVEPNCAVSFGFGPPVVDDFLDINDGWTYGANEAEALKRVGAAFQTLLKRSGRTIDDLAAVLGTSVHELQMVLQLVEDNRRQ